VLIRAPEPPLASVADLQLSDFPLRSGFARRGGRGARERPAERDSYEDEEEGEFDRQAEEPRRLERGSAESRAALPSLPLTPEQLFARRAAARGAVSSAAEEDEELSSFTPRVLSREPGTASGEAFFSPLSWSSLGVSPELEAALRGCGAARPSHIQASAWQLLSQPPHPSRSPHALITDAAGSGKTLAYLAPIAQALTAAEAAGGARAGPSAPHALVLAPTAELASQVHGVSRQLSAHGVRWRCSCATGGRSEKVQSASLAAGCELLVATPGRAARLCGEGALSLRQLRFLVLDEADVLLGDTGGFREELLPLLRAAPGCRLLLATATLPGETREALSQQLNGGRPWACALGPGLHRPQGGLSERLVDCSGGAAGRDSAAPVFSQHAGFRRKMEALVRLLAVPSPPGVAATATLVFCNTLESCRDVENALKRRDKKAQRFEVLPLHAAVSPAQRLASLQALLSPRAAGAPPAVVVSTDRASRGLDCSAVCHVVLFDFPRDPSEYVRRAGRTARGAGGEGRLTSLVLGRQVQLAQSILQRNANGQPLL